METVWEKADLWNSCIGEILDVKNIVNKCNKACMECLSCPHNGNSNLNLILQWLFNSWKNLDDIKWRDVNWWCRLTK